MKTVDENRRVLWLMHALMLLIAVPSTLLGALTPYLTQRFSLTYTQIGMLGSAQGIGGIVSMLAGGLLSDRMPKLRLAGWVLLLLTGSAAGLCIVDSYPILILFLALVQFSANLLSMVISSYWCEQPNGSHQLSYGHALYGIGSLIGPLYAAGMVAASHEQSAFLVVGILGVALLIIGFPSFREKKSFSPFLCAVAQVGIELLKINPAFSAICKKQGKRGCLTMRKPQPVEKTRVGRQRPQTALCGPLRRMSAAKPCATLVLGYALHGFQPFLALVGLRPPLVAGFGLR